MWGKCLLCNTVIEYRALKKGGKQIRAPRQRWNLPVKVTTHGKHRRMNGCSYGKIAPFVCSRCDTGVREALNLKVRRVRGAGVGTDYSAYIQSEDWLRVRRVIFDARGRRCELCGRADGEMHVHHKNYSFLGHELDNPSCLSVLCAKCHLEVVHHCGKRDSVQSKPGTKLKLASA
jgi:hypothetical protein